MPTPTKKLTKQKKYKYLEINQHVFPNISENSQHSCITIGWKRYWKVTFDTHALWHILDKIAANFLIYLKTNAGKLNDLS